MTSIPHFLSTYFISCAKLVVVAFFIVVFFIFPILATAQEEGVGISPATIEETIDPGVTKEYAVTIENLNNSEQKYFLSTRNIKGVEAGGVPVFATDNLEKTGYELADWIDLSVTEVVVPSRGKVQVPFVLSVPEAASPGSHFGGVFISVDPPDIVGSGAAVGYQVANIISIRVSGDAIEQAGVREFSTVNFFHNSQDVDFQVRIENTGNVLVRPTGPLEIYNMLGNKVGNIVFNESQSGVFPGTVETFSNINWTGDSLGFGRYEAVVSPVYGDFGAIKTMTSTVTFWILPMSIIGPALGVLAVLVLLTYIFVRIYIKRSLAHITQGRRIVRKRNQQGSSAWLLVTVMVLAVTALFLIVLLALFA